MTTQNNQSALAAALTAPYKRRERRPTYVLLAAAIVGLQAMAFALSALMHASESDPGTALALGPGAVGAALIAFGLLRGNRVAYIMTVAYGLVAATLIAVLDHRPSVPTLALLILLGTTSARNHFFHR